MLEKLIPVFYTKEINATKDFYTQIIGFKTVSEDSNNTWAILQLDNVEIMMSQPNEHLPFEKPNFTGTFYIRTSKVDDLWNKLKNKVSVCYPIENFEYGMREFAIYDNNGYILQFGQEIEYFING